MTIKITFTQLTFTYLKLTIKTLEKVVKYVYINLYHYFNSLTNIEILARHYYHFKLAIKKRTIVSINNQLKGQSSLDHWLQKFANYFNF